MRPGARDIHRPPPADAALCLCRNQRFGKISCPITAISGKPYGCVFEITRTGLRFLEDVDCLSSSEERSAGLSPDAAGSADNRDIVDTNTSQKFSHEEIEAMKAQGVAGSEIIKALVQHSETWGSKTQFSQHKWLARKEQKYAPRVRLCRCSAATVSEAYFQKHREKVNNLRPDSVAQILAFGNVFAGGQVLVFDTCMGVVTGAVAERLGGHGRILAAYAGQYPSFDALKHFNLSDRESGVLVPFHTSEIGKLEEEEEEPDESPEAIAARAQKLIDDIPSYLRNKIEGFASDVERQQYLVRRAGKICKQAAKPLPGTIRKWLRAKSNSLIISTKFSPTTVLLELLPYLASSAPFVVFCQFLEPLVECFRELQTRCLACKLQLSNTWSREYQVIARTRLICS